MNRAAGLVLVLVLLVMSLAQCVGQYDCYRDHHVIALLGGCSMGSSYTSDRTHSRSRVSHTKSSRSR